MQLTKSYTCRSIWIKLQRLFIMSQGILIILLVEGNASFANERWHIGGIRVQNEIELGIGLVELVTAQQAKVGTRQQVVRVVHKDLVRRCVQSGCLEAVLFLELLVLFFICLLDIVGRQCIKCLCQNATDIDMTASIRVVPLEKWLFWKVDFWFLYFGYFIWIRHGQKQRSTNF